MLPAKKSHRLIGEDERGAAAVEFALILSLVFIILFGIIQFGIAFNRYQGINAAAREGARLGSTENTTVDQVRSRVLDSLSILNPANFSGLYTCPALTTEQGCIEVAQETGVSTGVYGSPIPSGGTFTCDAAHTNYTVKVSVKYKMLITIPLWASPTVNANGTGIFKCE